MERERCILYICAYSELAAMKRSLDLISTYKAGRHHYDAGILETIKVTNI